MPDRSYERPQLARVVIALLVVIVTCQACAYYLVERRLADAEGKYERIRRVIGVDEQGTIRVSAAEYRLVDGDGVVRGRLRINPDQSSELQLMDPNGNPGLAFRVADGEATLTIGRASESQAVLQASRAVTGLQLLDAAQRTRLRARIAGDKTSELGVYDSRGLARAAIEINGNETSVMFRDRTKLQWKIP